MWAMPPTRVAKTSGAMIILINRRNSMATRLTLDAISARSCRKIVVDQGAHDDAKRHGDQNITSELVGHAMIIPLTPNDKSMTAMRGDGQASGSRSLHALCISRLLPEESAP